MNLWRVWPLILVAATASARRAPAQDSDGSYGRIEGDLLFDGELGGALIEGGGALEVRASLLYLSTAGGFVRYLETFNQGGPFERRFAVGVELRPLFLGRYGLNLEQGPPHLDLFLDSLSLSMGLTWERGATPGMELGVGLEFPVLPSATGIHVGVVGLVHFRDVDFLRGPPESLGERGSALIFGLSWNHVISTGLVTLRDRD